MVRVRWVPTPPPPEAHQTPKKPCPPGATPPEAHQTPTQGHRPPRLPPGRRGDNLLRHGDISFAYITASDCCVYFYMYPPKQKIL